MDLDSQRKHLPFKASSVKIVECSKKWLNLSGNEKELADNLDNRQLLELSLDEAIEKQPDIGFHATCYRRFIDSKRLTAAEKRQRTREVESTPSEVSHSPPKRPRLRVREKSALSSRSGPVLPARCIICKKVDLLITVNKKRVRDKLSQAESKDGGKQYSP